MFFKGKVSGRRSRTTIWAASATAVALSSSVLALAVLPERDGGPLGNGSTAPAATSPANRSDEAGLTPVAAMPDVPTGDRVLAGDDAIDALGGIDGDLMAQVAEFNGRTAAEMAEEFAHDPTLHVNHDGALLHADTLDPAHLAADVAVADAPASGAPASDEFATSGATGGIGAPTVIAPLADTFRLHSKTDSLVRATLYLDFDGHTFAADDKWGLDGQTAAAWDPGMNGPEFSDAELLKIQEIWSRVAETFAPANIDVTTEEPAQSRFLSTSAPWAFRVLVSPSVTWGGSYPARIVPADSQQGVGGTVGVAYRGGAAEGRHRQYWGTPGLVLAGRLRTASVDTYAYTIAHEAGHMLGWAHPFDDASYPMGKDSSDLHMRLMDYGNLKAARFVTPSEWSLLNSTTSSRRSFVGAASRIIRTGPGRYAGAVGPGLSAATTFTGCTSLDVRASVAEFAPALDVELVVRDAAGVVGRDAPVTTVGTPLRNAGVDARVTIPVADPTKTYRVEVNASASTPEAPVYAAGVGHGSFDLTVVGCGDDVVTGAPVGVKAELELAGSSLTGAAVVSWGAPRHPGSGEVTYEVAVDGRRVVALPGSARSHRIADVAGPGTRVRVRAVNAAGSSRWVEVTTPSTVTPKAPLTVRAWRTTVTLQGVVQPVTMLHVTHHPDFVGLPAKGSARLCCFESEGVRYLSTFGSASDQVMFVGDDYPAGARVRYDISHPGFPVVSTWLTVDDEVGAPGIPQDVTATADGQHVDVSWAPAPDPGGFPPSFEVKVGEGAWWGAGASARTLSVADVAPGEHTVSVRARHAHGVSEAATTTVTVAGAGASASRPRAVEIVEDASGSTLRWEPPKRLHGRSVESWRVTIGGRVVDVDGTHRQLMLTGFRADRALEVTIAAVTTDGTTSTVGDSASVRLGPGA